MIRPFVSVAVLSLTLVAADMHAQQTSNGLEEILVTAQRRTQNLQNVPISISVVSAQELARNAIFNFSETVQLTPGVEVNATSPTLASIKLRGVGPDFFAAGAAQSVPIFVDEVAASQPGAVFSTLNDVQRIELLRGPQGTLYGRNAPAGAYNITTVAPSFDGVSGFVQGSYSEWENNGEATVDTRGALNLPLMDEQLALRISGVYAESDGSIKMGSPLATEDSTGGKDHKGLRVRLLWVPSADSEIHLHADYQDLTDYYGWQSYEGLVPSTGGSNSLPAIYSDFNDRTDYGTFRSGSETEVEGFALRYLRTAELADVAAVLGYQKFDTLFVQNQSPNPTDEEGRVDVDLVTEQYTLELRISDAGDAFDYVAGVFLISRETEADSFLGVGGADVFNYVETDSQGQAAFGNVTLHLAQAWDFSVGLRYDENTDKLFSDVDVSNFPAVIDEKLDSSHLSWSLKLSNYINDNTTAYLAIDNAYREGGLNPYGPAILSIGEVLQNDQIVDTAPLFFSTDEEVSTAFELGVKGTLMDKKLRYSADIFYQEYKDHITMLPQPNSPDLDILGALYTLVNDNVAEVVTQGIELDMTYLASKHWTVDFRLAYSDATIEKWDTKFCSDEFGDPVGEAICAADSGQDLTNLPKINTNTQVNYARPLENDWLLFSNLSWTWRSRSVGERLTERYNDPLNFINVSIGLTDGRFLVRLWGKNLTDEIAGQLPKNTENGDPSLPSALTLPFTSGREIGLTVGYDF